MLTILKHDKSNLCLYTKLLIATFYVQVSVGTLLAFSMVAISVLILRYVPPDEVPLPSSLQESIDSASLEYGRSGQKINGKRSKVKFGTSTTDSDKPLLFKEDASGEYPLTAKHLFLGNCKSLIYACLLLFVSLHPVLHCINPWHLYDGANLRSLSSENTLKKFPCMNIPASILF
jgi:hypothetical protein